MSNRGRFGKYGEQKRMDRLRQARNRPSDPATIAARPASNTLRHVKQPHRKAHIAVRPAAASDVAFIRWLSRKAFHRYGPYEDLLPNWFLSGIGLVLVAVLQERPAGFAMLERMRSEAICSGVSELLAIAVAPSARRRGAGDQLMQEIIRQSDLLLVKKLVLHTAVDNLPAQALFRKHGFVPLATQRQFYPEGQDALVMEREKA
jgi:ribosomal protein S18 acetylase RimI-like enzyme